MKTVTKIQTLDGKLHDSVKGAEKHLEKLYADKLCKLAHKILGRDCEKYSDLLDFIDANLESFVAASRIKDDLADRS